MIYPEYSAVVTWFPLPYLNLIYQFPGVWGGPSWPDSGPDFGFRESHAAPSSPAFPVLRSHFEPNFLVTVDEGTYLTALSLNASALN